MHQTVVLFFLLPPFHIHLVVTQPSVYQDTEIGCYVRLRVTRQDLDRGTLLRSHTLHGQG